MFETITTILVSLIGVASVIVKITPTQKDDTLLAKTVDLLDNFSIFFKKSDAVILELAKTNEAVQNSIKKALKDEKSA